MIGADGTCIITLAPAPAEADSSDGRTHSEDASLDDSAGRSMGRIPVFGLNTVVWLIRITSSGFTPGGSGFLGVPDGLTTGIGILGFVMLGLRGTSGMFESS